VAVIQNKAAVRAAAMKSIADLEARFAKNVEALVHEIDDHIKSLTPVYTGQAVRNYIWTMGSPNTIVYDAINNGPTGFTSRMALGTEPRRGDNEAAAAESIATLNFRNPFGVIYLTNNSPDIVGLELGIFPVASQSRSPNGMFKITEGFFATKIASKGILS
jgi:hypothetical protein